MRLISITFRDLDVIRLKQITAFIKRHIFPVSLSKLIIRLHDLYRPQYILDLSDYSLFWETLSTHSPMYYKRLTTIEVFYNTLEYHSNKKEISSMIVLNSNFFLSHLEHLCLPMCSTEGFKKIVHFIISGGLKSLKSIRFSFGFSDNFLYSPDCMDDYMTLKSHRPNLIIHNSFTIDLKDNLLYPFLKKIVELNLPTSHYNLFECIRYITQPDDVSFHMQSSMILKNLLDHKYFYCCSDLVIEIDFRSHYRDLGS